MLIKTKDFDYVDISENDIIAFPNGIYGFDGVDKFVLLKNPENQWMMHMQSTIDSDPRLILFDPFIFVEDYKPILPEGSFELLKASDTEDICFFVVAVIPENIKDATINLKSPIVINFKKKTGAQIILENRDYSTTTRLFSGEGMGG
ncbi:MAG: flagellar assembly protein FliW [Eubacteriales bacterium]|jgi:flagellar assembly factor FliW|nr:flagellar assembly protein FliW [Eubacteriales bacterium]MDD4422324.1 flagellar assembly protein FliW [Eubacteriales bacterium]